MSVSEFFKKKMSGYISNPDVKRVKELFDYDIETGNLIRRKLNKITGTLNPLGYKYTKIDGKTVPVHRLVYIWHHGRIPDHYHIDHKDFNRSNNRIENLQALPPSENLSKRSRSNHKGVYKTSDGSQWIAKVTITLGIYKSELEAAAAIKKFRNL